MPAFVAASLSSFSATMPIPLPPRLVPELLVPIGTTTGADDSSSRKNNNRIAVAVAGVDVGVAAARTFMVLRSQRSSLFFDSSTIAV